jgi:hypothetical protein
MQVHVETLRGSVQCAYYIYLRSVETDGERIGEERPHLNILDFTPRFIATGMPSSSSSPDAPPSPLRSSRLAISAASISAMVCFLGGCAVGSDGCLGADDCAWPSCAP